MNAFEGFQLSKIFRIYSNTELFFEEHHKSCARDRVPLLRCVLRHHTNLVLQESSGKSLEKRLARRL